MSKRKVDDSRKNIIICQIETNSHDGYCSGAECDYELHKKSIILTESEINEWKEYLANPKLMSMSYSDHFFEDNYDDTFKGFWSFIQVKLSLDEGVDKYLGYEGNNSGYCENSNDRDEIGMVNHSFRIKILEVNLIDNERYN